MPQTNRINMSYVLRLEPDLAVDYLRAKGVNITWNWHEQLEEAHARAFTVAKATKAEVLDTLRWATEKAIANGTPEREYIKKLEPMLKDLGWWGKAVDENGETVQLGSPRRLKTILRTNKSTAYHAARYAQQTANADEQPYWQYIAVKDNRTRASHLALHGKIYRADDPIWQTLYPPNDWGCRCRVEALSEFALKRKGLTVSSSAGQMEEIETTLGLNKLTGEALKTTVTQITTEQGTMRTGAGWSYNVGSSAFGTDIAIIRKLQQFKNRELRQQVIQAINHSEARHKAFSNWVEAFLDTNRVSNRYAVAGFVTEDIADKVLSFSSGKKLSERVLVMTEHNVYHASRKKHKKGGVGLSNEEYTSISRIIANPDLVLWDSLEGHQNLIYIDKERKIKVVVEPSFNKKRLKPKENLDALINAYRVDLEDVRKQIKGGNFKIIKGEL